MPIQKLSRAEKAFLDSFLRLIKTTPIDKITVAALIEDSGYSKGAFYKHFESRDSFFKSIVDNEILNFINVTRNTYVESDYSVKIDGNVTTESLVRLFDYIYNKRELYRFIFSNYNYFNTVEYFFNGTYNSVPEYVLDFEEDELPNPDREIFVYLSMYVQKAAIKYWVEHNFEKSPEYMALQCDLFQRKRPKTVTLKKSDRSNLGRNR